MVGSLGGRSGSHGSGGDSGDGSVDRRIARWRLASQHLSGPGLGSAEAVVDSLLAVQAENHSQSSWAVAARTSGMTEVEFTAAYDAGEILRTHVMRPTWHFVTPADIGWLLDLTGPRIWGSTFRNLANRGLDPAALERAGEIVTAALAGDGPRTRPEIGAYLDDAGLPSTGQLLGHQLAWCEMHGLICSGPLRDGTHTYALLDERSPDRRRLDRDEALAELALRYFTSHGPATERDLAYWATQTLTDVRAGIASVADQLESFDHDGRTFWHAPIEGSGPEPADATPEPRGHILQILDETFRGYQDSRWVIDTDKLVTRGREPSIGMLLVDAQMVGYMTRTVRADDVEFTVRPMRHLDDGELAAIEAAASRYARYLDREPTVTWTAA